MYSHFPAGACWERCFSLGMLLGNEKLTIASVPSRKPAGNVVSHWECCWEIKLVKLKLEIESILEVPSWILLGIKKPFPVRTCWERAFPAATLLGTPRIEGDFPLSNTCRLNLQDQRSFRNLYSKRQPERPEVLLCFFCKAWIAGLRL